MMTHRFGPVFGAAAVLAVLVLFAAAPVWAAGSTAGINSSDPNNTVGLITNSTERLHIDSAGNVGIGTTSPRTSLDTWTGTASGSINDYDKAQATLSGGGTVTWAGTGGKLKWTGRFIAIPVAQTSASAGYIDVAQPTSNIPAGQVFSGVARTADSNGVVLNSWEALWAVHTPGGNNSAVAYYITIYTTAFNAPSNWLLVAAVNGDDNSIKLGNGATIPAGASFVASSGQIAGSGTANYVARWTGTNTLGTGVLYDNGTNVGIGTTAPNTTLDVRGNIYFGATSNGAASNQQQITSDGSGASMRLTSPAGLFLNAGSTKFSVSNGTTCESGSLFCLASSGNVGIGVTSPNELLDVEQTSTATSGYPSPVHYDYLTASPASASTANYYAALHTGGTSSTHVSGAAIYGAVNNVYNFGTSTLGAAYGAEDTIANNTTGTVANGWGALDRVVNVSTGTITTAISLQADLINTTGGAVTNWYGLYVPAVTGPAPTTARWPVYVADSGANYFAGPVYSGTTGGDWGINWQLEARKDQNAATYFGVNNATVGASAASIFEMVGGTGNSWYQMSLNDNNGSPYVAVNAGSAISAINFSANSYVFKSQGGTAWATINSSGNVGIGTTSPSAPLQVVQTTNTPAAGINVTGAASNVTVSLTNTGTSGTTWWLDSASSGSAWGGGTLSIGSGAAYSGTPSMTFSGSNVGIGVTGPASQLTVSGAGQTANNFSTTGSLAGALELDDTGASAGNGGAILFSAGTQAWKFAAIKGYVTNGGGNSQGDIVFATRPVAANATLTDVMHITSSGYVGIGTTGPTYDLDVQGSTGNVRVLSSTATNAAYLDVVNTNHTRVGSETSAGGGLFGGSSPYASVFGGQQAYPTQFATNNNIRMTIDSSGNVGIGSTGPTQKLDVNGNINLGNSTSNTIFFGANGVAAPGASSAGEKIQLYGTAGTVGASDYALGIQGNTMWFNSNSAYEWYVNSGAIAYLSSTGLGIGTTSPNSLLDLQGAAAVSGPTLGTQTGTLAIGSWDKKYGTYIGVTGGGNTWLQSQRNDGNTATYNLLFNPSGGNVGIGATSPQASLDVETASSLGVRGVISGQTSADANGPEINLMKSRAGATVQNADSLGAIYDQAYDGTNYVNTARIKFLSNGTVATGSIPTDILFMTGSSGGGTERMRIDSSGNVGIGTPSPIVGYSVLNSYGTTNKVPLALQSITAGYQAIDITVPAATYVVYVRGVGTGIYYDGSALAYNTSSDYRLKEHIQPIKDALSRVMHLPAYSFNFKTDPGHSVEGFLAHEAQAVAPYAVHGKKDEVDAKGNPVYQALDYGKLTPLLTGAIQELKADNDNLRAALQATKADEQAGLTALRRDFESYKAAHR
jgi:hypothetical protein